MLGESPPRQTPDAKTRVTLIPGGGESLKKEGMYTGNEDVLRGAGPSEDRVGVTPGAAALAAGAPDPPLHPGPGSGCDAGLMETLPEVVRGVVGPGSDWGGAPSTSTGPPSLNPLPQFQDPASSENCVIACFGNLVAEFAKQLWLREGSFPPLPPSCAPPSASLQPCDGLGPLRRVGWVYLQCPPKIRTR